MAARAAVPTALALSLLSALPVGAQAQIWSGPGNDYNTAGNWAPPVAPTSPGTAAVFSAAGPDTIAVSAAINPDSWTFTTDAQAYTISGSTVTFNTSPGIVDNANLGQTISIANSLNGAAAVQVNGSSLLVLSGTNTYSGGTAVSNFGVVQVTNNSAVGSSPVTLTFGEFQAGAPGLNFSNAFVINTGPSSAFDANGHRLTISGNITDGNGPGAVTIVNSSFGGKVVFTGTNTYTGGTMICGCGILQLGNSGNTGSMLGPVDNEGEFRIVNADTSGITSINNDGGLTQFFNSTTASTIAITNRNNGETDFFRQSSAANATIVNRSGGVTTFNNSSSAANANITNRFGSATSFYDTSTAGAAAITNRFGGNLIFSDSSTAGSSTITNNFGGNVIFSNNSSGGSATITNGSPTGFLVPVGLAFLDNSSAGNATIINNNNGVIAFGQPFLFDTATAGNATIVNNLGGEIDFNAFSTGGNATITTNSGGAIFFDNSTGGNARLIANGTGFIDFSPGSGPNGDGHVSAGSIEGSGSYYIGGGNTLTVGSNDLSTLVSGVIADSNPCGCGSPGSGALEKVGAGTLVLAGTNTYTGATNVNGGTLEVDGSIASSSLISVNSGGTLSGIGTIGETQINSGGTFMPGAMGLPGSSTIVQGNLAFQSGALYLVQVNPATASFATVSGTASLDGTVFAAFAPGNYLIRSYTILTSSGLNGTTFTGLATLNLPPNFGATLSYTTTDALLNLDAALGNGGNLNVNQQNVASTLNNFFNGGGTLPLGFLNFFNLTGINLGNALSQLSGEVATDAGKGAFELMNQFLLLMLDPFVDGRFGGGGFNAPGFAPEPVTNFPPDVALGYNSVLKAAPSAANGGFDRRWTAWGSSFGGSSTVNGNAAIGSNNVTARDYGFAGGMDYHFSSNTLAGFGLAGGGTNWNVAQGLGNGRSDAFLAGLYGKTHFGPAYVAGALAYGNNWFTTNRLALGDKSLRHLHRAKLWRASRDRLSLWCGPLPSLLRK